MASAGTGPKSMRTQRDAMVTSSGGMCSARMTNTVLSGGSSIVFRSLGAASRTRWKSTGTRTLRRPSTGLSDASCTMRAAWATSM